MGTISYLRDRGRRAEERRHPPVTVNAYGFTVGATFVPWQTVAEIRAWKADMPAPDEAFLGFLVGSSLVSVSELQAGFAELEVAMIAAFPGTARWREAVLQPASERNDTVLYRRC